MMAFVLGFLFFAADYHLLKLLGKWMFEVQVQPSYGVSCLFLLAKLPVLVAIVVWARNQNPAYVHIMLLTAGMLAALIICAVCDYFSYHRKVQTLKE